MRPDLKGAVVSVQEILAYVDRDRYLDKRQASDYIGLSTRTLEGRLDEIPHFRVGKKIVFKKSELDHWMETFREGTSHKLNRIADEAIESLKG